ncbi:Holliday junction resolvase RuvX [Luedemannella helvata]|uniref:Putative pre-16S rRNA nuclease n=1 Tax=Luedemannella helvata TaxID=349315 RepID=A0ABP4WEF1_9ACTN
MVTAQADGWRRGVRIGVDVGAARVGVARCDPDGILATPVATLARDPGPAPGRPGSPDAYIFRDMAQIAEYVREYEAVEVVVGLPVTLAGAEGIAAQHARTYAQVLGKLIAPVPVHLADERMSTVAATRRLSERGVRGKRQRAVVDQVAAVEILQQWVDKRRRT